MIDRSEWWDERDWALASPSTPAVRLNTLTAVGNMLPVRMIAQEMNRQDIAPLQVVSVSATAGFMRSATPFLDILENQQPQFGRLVARENRPLNVVLPPDAQQIDTRGLIPTEVIENAGGVRSQDSLLFIGNVEANQGEAVEVWTRSASAVNFTFDPPLDPIVVEAHWEVVQRVQPKQNKKFQEFISLLRKMSLNWKPNARSR